MRNRILITGSSGLVGRALRAALRSHGYHVSGLDLCGKGKDAGDVRKVEDVLRAMEHCDGVVHLAAVSRVIWGERDPDQCWATNVGGLSNVIEAATRQQRAPWVVFASSREVYGQPGQLPAHEDVPLRPVNVYGRSKAEGERMVDVARRDGLRTAIVRLSNVYGSTRDHADRVVPAFARAAVLGHPIRVDGAGHTFDFTHIDDVARGLVSLVVRMLDGAEITHPLQFVTGQPTTLGQLAMLAIELGANGSSVQHAPPRSFDVARFYGSYERARALLGWMPRVGIGEGLVRLINDFRRELGAPQNHASLP